MPKLVFRIGHSFSPFQELEKRRLKSGKKHLHQRLGMQALHRQQGNADFELQALCCGNAHFEVYLPL